ncbi:MAG: ADP-ribosylglycohydrolase family protein [Chloroflexi bacterium]|nr:ADP-ribosylglycohydrolase family protein [Chloroflexota bacterium]
MLSVRTSESHPIRVDWLPTPWRGKVGLTLAPGKQNNHSISGPPWRRDLQQDLERLSGEYEPSMLVSLLEEHEYADLRVPSLRADARQRGWEVVHFPIPDGGVPRDVAAVQKLVSSIISAAADGRNVVIHCRGGLGRAGTIGGCVLVAAGKTPDEAVAILHEVRAPNSPETREQERFIASYAAVEQEGDKPAPALQSRILGCVLGAAIGDAMGHPTEFIGSFDAIRRAYAPAGVTGYVKYWEREGLRFAPYTDDTQMAEAVLRSLVTARDGQLSRDGAMTLIAEAFVDWSEHPQGGHRAPGNSCMAGCSALAGGAHWSLAGGATAGGCGSVMRAYPFGVIFRDDVVQAEAWAVDHSKLTHRDPIAFAACAAMAVGVALTLQGADDDRVLAEMVDAASAHSAETGTMLAEAIESARNGEPPESTLLRLQGWAAHEAIAAAAYVIVRHPRDVRVAILEAANTPGDSDSIATLVGALLGARCGLESLPSGWVREVERSEELLELATEAGADGPSLF